MIGRGAGTTTHDAAPRPSESRTDSRLRAVGYRGVGESILFVLGVGMLVALVVGITWRLVS